MGQQRIQELQNLEKAQSAAQGGLEMQKRKIDSVYSKLDSLCRTQPQNPQIFMEHERLEAERQRLQQEMRIQQGKLQSFGTMYQRAKKSLESTNYALEMLGVSQK